MTRAWSGGGRPRRGSRALREGGGAKARSFRGREILVLRALEEIDEPLTLGEDARGRLMSRHGEEAEAHLRLEAAEAAQVMVREDAGHGQGEEEGERPHPAGETPHEPRLRAPEEGEGDGAGEKAGGGVVGFLG